MNKAYTVWVQQSNGRGTTHVSSYACRTSEEATGFALEETSEDWGGWDKDDLRVLGIAEGDVNLIEWNDLDEGT